MALLPPNILPSQDTHFDQLVTNKRINSKNCFQFNLQATNNIFFDPNKKRGWNRVSKRLQSVGKVYEIRVESLDENANQMMESLDAMQGEEMQAGNQQTQVTNGDLMGVVRQRKGKKVMRYVSEHPELCHLDYTVETMEYKGEPNQRRENILIRGFQERPLVENLNIDHQYSFGRLPESIDPLLSREDGLPFFPKLWSEQEHMPLEMLGQFGDKFEQTFGVSVDEWWNQAVTQQESSDLEQSEQLQPSHFEANQCEAYDTSGEFSSSELVPIQEVPLGSKVVTFQTPPRDNRSDNGKRSKIPKVSRRKGSTKESSDQTPWKERVESDLDHLETEEEWERTVEKRKPLDFFKMYEELMKKYIQYDFGENKTPCEAEENFGEQTLLGKEHSEEEDQASQDQREYKMEYFPDLYTWSDSSSDDSKDGRDSPAPSQLKGSQLPIYPQNSFQDFPPSDQMHQILSDNLSSQNLKLQDHTEVLDNISKEQSFLSHLRSLTHSSSLNLLSAIRIATSPPLHFSISKATTQIIHYCYKHNLNIDATSLQTNT